MRRSALAVLITLAALAAPSAALADGAAVIRDCQDGKIDAKYSASEFANALRNIPTDVDEYTDCRDVIRRAQLGTAAGSGGGGTGGTGATPGLDGNGSAGGTAAQLIAAATPAQRKAVKEAIADGGADPVAIGDRTVSPDASGLSPAGAANVVPTPLIVALVLLALGLVVGGAHTLRTRVLARRTPAT